LGCGKRGTFSGESLSYLFLFFQKARKKEKRIPIGLVGWFSGFLAQKGLYYHQHHFTVFNL